MLHEAIRVTPGVGLDSSEKSANDGFRVFARVRCSMYPTNHMNRKVSGDRGPACRTQRTVKRSGDTVVVDKTYVVKSNTLRIIEAFLCTPLALGHSVFLNDPTSRPGVRKVVLNYRGAKETFVRISDRRRVGVYT